MQLTPRRAVLAGSSALGALALAPAAARAARTGGRVPLLSTYVAGTGYHQAATAAPRLRPGDPLVLRRRPDSSYDPRTVEVRTVDGALLGHLPRIDNQAVARLMDAGVAADAVVSAVVPDSSRPTIRLEVTVTLA
jgi:hypothetical protein